MSTFIALRSVVQCVICVGRCNKVQQRLRAACCSEPLLHLIAHYEFSVLIDTPVSFRIRFRHVPTKGLADKSKLRPSMVILRYAGAAFSDQEIKIGAKIGLL